MPSLLRRVALALGVSFVSELYLSTSGRMATRLGSPWDETDLVAAALLFAAPVFLALQGLRDVARWPPGPRRLALVVGPLLLGAVAVVARPSIIDPGPFAAETLWRVLRVAVVVLSVVAVASWVQRGREDGAHHRGWEAIRRKAAWLSARRGVAAAAVAAPPVLSALSAALTGGQGPSYGLGVSATIISAALGVRAPDGLALVASLRGGIREGAALGLGALAVAAGLALSYAFYPVFEAAHALGVAAGALSFLWFLLAGAGAALTAVWLVSWVRDGFGGGDLPRTHAEADKI